MTWEEIDKLEPDWDSYGAPIPTEETKKWAKKTNLLTGKSASYIVADVMGGVALGWIKGDKQSYISFENDGQMVVARYKMIACDSPNIEIFETITDNIIIENYKKIEEYMA